MVQSVSQWWRRYVCSQPDKSKFPHSCRVIQTMDVRQAALDHGTEVWTQLVSTANQCLELRKGHIYVQHTHTHA